MPSARTDGAAFSYFFAAQLPNEAIIDLLERQLAARRETLECIAISYHR